MRSDPVSARADGKAAVLSRTVWRLDVGPVSARCLKENNEFIVQVKGPKGWNRAVGRGPYALALLKATAASAGVRTAIEELCKP